MLALWQAVDFVRERLQRGESPREICGNLCDRCLAPDTNGTGKGCGATLEFTLL